MAECNQDEIDPEETPGYKAPAKKSLDEILNQDQEDESLRKYKEALLGKKSGDVPTLGDPSKPKVVVEKIIFTIGDNREDDKTFENLEEMSKDVVMMPEGCDYKVKIFFKVYNQICAGLKMTSVVKKLTFKDKDHRMVGTRAPQQEAHEFEYQEKAPSGMLARGKYAVTSEIHDDDKILHANWAWNLELKKKKSDKK